MRPVARRLTYRALHVQYYVRMASERTTNYTEARQNLKSLDNVIEDRAPVIINTNNGRPGGHAGQIGVRRHEDDETIFLKTIIPSRKMTSLYVGGTE